jgi:hypothetical protein
MMGFTPGLKVVVRSRAVVSDGVDVVPLQAVSIAATHINPGIPRTTGTAATISTIGCDVRLNPMHTAVAMKRTTMLCRGLVISDHPDTPTTS